MQREDFIAQMIAELTRQKLDDENTFTKPRVRSSKEIFESLCFDFPIISTEEISILSEEIFAFTKSSVRNMHFDIFWLNNKFLENIVYLSGSTLLCQETCREKAVSSLCAALFIDLPLRLLSMTRRELSSFFCGLTSTHEGHDQFCNFTGSNREANFLSWEETSKRYRRFVLQGTASLLSSVEGLALTNDKACGRGYLCTLSEAIKKVQESGDSQTNEKMIADSDSMTLEQCFSFNNELYLKTGGAAASMKRGADESVETESQCSIVSGIAKDVWVHFSFLSRDLMVQNPGVLVHPSALPTVLGALISPKGSSPSTSFPTAAECMVTLILAGVVAGITAPPVASKRSATSSHEPVDKNVTADMLERDHERRRLRDQQCSDARTGLKEYLNSSSTPLLTMVVSICERISCVAASGTKGDGTGAALLCDIVALYSTDAAPHSITHSHDRLTSSRAVSALVRMWLLFARSGLHSDSERRGAAESKGDCPGLGGGASHTDSMSGLEPSSSRIIQALSLLCLQRPETAVFVLRIPHFAKTVLLSAQHWHKSENVEGEEEAEEVGPTHLLPGDAIGLLTALALAAEATPHKSTEFSTENLSECLGRSLSLVRHAASSSFTAANMRRERLRAGPTPIPDPNPSLDAALRSTGEQRSRHRVPAIPQGLLASLRLMVSEDGGARSLRKVSGQQASHPQHSAVTLLRAWTGAMLSSCSGGQGPDSSAGRRRGVTSSVLEPAHAGERGQLAVELSMSAVACSSSESTEGQRQGLISDAVLDIVTDTVIAVREEAEGEAEAEIGVANSLEGEQQQEEAEEEEEEGCADRVEELRRLVKALQAILQGFSTSKVD